MLLLLMIVQIAPPSSDVKIGNCFLLPLFLLNKDVTATKSLIQIDNVIIRHCHIMFDFGPSSDRL